MILTITSKRDGHLEPVARHLDAMGESWVRLNTEDVPRNLLLTLNPVDAKGVARMLDSERSFDLQDVKAVWYRKPDPLDLSHFAIDQTRLDYVEAEFAEVMQGLYALLHTAMWVNNPLTSRPAHRKLLQLHVAKKVGFVVPRTLVTNQINVALEFAASVNWDIAIKSLGALGVTEHRGDDVVHYGVFTRRVGKDELLEQQEKIVHMPTVFQEYIEKAYEFRITCIGARTFCCRIDSQSNPESKEDFRFSTRTLQHELVERPDLEPMLQAYMKAFNINFGCFDFGVTHSGDVVFFECNPNGQWLWIEELTGAPIGKAVAEFLVECPEPAQSKV